MSAPGSCRSRGAIPLPAAKNSQATFTVPGSYTLTVIMTDAQNQTVTSNVIVVVPNQAPTVANAAAASTNAGYPAKAAH